MSLKMARREVSFRGFNMTGSSKFEEYDFKPFKDKEMALTISNATNKPLGGISSDGFSAGLGSIEVLTPLTTTILDPMLNKLKRPSLGGVYILIDFHQDTFSRYVGGSNGAPKWIVDGMGELPEKSAKLSNALCGLCTISLTRSPDGTLLNFGKMKRSKPKTVLESFRQSIFLC